MAPHSTRGVDGAPGVPDDDLVSIFAEIFLGQAVVGFGQAVVGFPGPVLVTVAPDNPETRAAAEAILASAAQDLATLENWFSYRWSDQPYAPWVSIGDDGDPAPHAASRWFYGHQSPRIKVYGATLANAGGSPAIRDELARMLFVAEMAEMFMHAAPTNWNPGNSAGEALSRVAAAELRPARLLPPRGLGEQRALLHRLAAAALAPPRRPARRRERGPLRLRDGLQRHRHRHRLVRLRHPLPLLPARPAAVLVGADRELERRPPRPDVAELTGRPEQSAFPEFADVLDAHLPPGTNLVPPRESVFPLRAHPAVLLYETYGTPHSAPRGELYIAMLKPGPTCPKGEYDYHVVDMTTPVTVTARAPGSFAPSFQWFVGGTSVTAGPSQEVTVRVRVVDTRPGTGEPAEDDVPLRLRCTVTDSATTRAGTSSTSTSPAISRASR